MRSGFPALDVQRLELRCPLAVGISMDAVLAGGNVALQGECGGVDDGRRSPVLTCDTPFAEAAPRSGATRVPHGGWAVREAGSFAARAHGPRQVPASAGFLWGKDRMTGIDEGGAGVEGGSIRFHRQAVTFVRRGNQIMGFQAIVPILCQTPDGFVSVSRFTVSSDDIPALTIRRNRFQHSGTLNAEDRLPNHVWVVISGRFRTGTRADVTVSIQTDRSGDGGRAACIGEMTLRIPRLDRAPAS